MDLPHLATGSNFSCSVLSCFQHFPCCCRWRFAQTPDRIYNQGSAEILPDADVKDLGRILNKKGYQVFRQGSSLYAFKGLAGRLGPIGVHASMLAIMAGVAIGGLGGYKGSVMVPTGGDFLVAQVSIANLCAYA